MHGPNRPATVLSSRSYANEVTASSPIRSGTGIGTAAVSVLGDAITEGFTATYDSATASFTLDGNISSPVTAGQAGGVWTLTVPNRVTVVITPTTAFANGDTFTFSVFKTAADDGKQNEINLGGTEVEDGP